MARRLLMAPGIAIALAVLPPAALAQSGGAVAPDAGNGGHANGQPAKPPVPAPRLRATRFSVSPGSVKPGEPLRFSYRVDGRVPRVDVRIDLLPADGGASTRLRLGRRSTGRRHSHVWTGELAPGRYVARLNASGRDGARLRRTARASGRSALEIVAVPAPPPPPRRPRPPRPRRRSSRCRARASSPSRARTASAARRHASAPGAPATCTRART